MNRRKIQNFLKKRDFIHLYYRHLKRLTNKNSNIPKQSKMSISDTCKNTPIYRTISLEKWTFVSYNLYCKTSQFGAF